MPGLSPSDLEWWQWLLCAAGAYLIAVVASHIRERADEIRVKQLSDMCRALAGFVFIVTVIVTLLCGLIGFIRLVKWIWNG